MRIKLLMLLFLIGCDSQVTHEMIKKSNLICDNHGGIKYIHIIGNDTVKCIDGLYAYIGLIEKKK